jgi:hypothetical protein
MRDRLRLRSSSSAMVALAGNGISLRLARWGRIYVLQRRVRKQNEVAPDAFVRYCELID